MLSLYVCYKNIQHKNMKTKLIKIVRQHACTNLKKTIQLLPKIMSNSTNSYYYSSQYFLSSKITILWTNKIVFYPSSLAKFRKNTDQLKDHCNAS